MVKPLNLVTRAAPNEPPVAATGGSARETDERTRAGTLMHDLTGVVVWPESGRAARDGVGTPFTELLARQGPYGSYLANAMTQLAAQIAQGRFPAFHDLWQATTGIRLHAPGSGDALKGLGKLRTADTDGEQFLTTPLKGRYAYVVDRVIHHPNAARTPFDESKGLYKYSLSPGELGTMISALAKEVDGQITTGPYVRWITEMFHPRAADLPEMMEQMETHYRAALTAPDEATFHSEAARF
jgi:hypothetical protein